METYRPANRRMIRRGMTGFISVWLALGLVPSRGTASSSVTARDLALGGAGVTAAVGPEALWTNPANLAAPNRPAFSLMLISGSLGASNNSFSLDQYNRFTEPGKELSESEKNEILESIPGGRFELRVEGAANALGMTAGPIGLAVTPRVFGCVSLAGDYFDFLFLGNELNREYSFDGSSGESMALLETALSFGRGISWLPLENSRAGFSIKYLSGAAYFQVLASEGRLVTYPTKATGRASVDIRFSGREDRSREDEGDDEYVQSWGGGFGFDLGFAGEITPIWSAAFMIRDIGSTITWDTATEKRYSYEVDSLTVANADEDELIVEDETDRPLSSLEVSLPTVMHLEVTRDTPGLLLSTAYEQSFRNFAGLSTTPRLIMGSEIRRLRWLPIRGSLSFGGGFGASFGGGFGLHLGAFRLDLAARTRSVNPASSKGGLLALTSYLRF